MKSIRHPFHKFLVRVVFGLAVAASCSMVPAATIFVTNTSDAVGFGDGCSLREAVINANTDSVSGSFDCTKGDPGPDTIVLFPGTVYVNSSLVDDDTAESGDIDITSPITILGGAPGWGNLDGNYSGRIFDVHGGGSLTLDGVRLVHGYESMAYGGAIRVQSGGVLNMTDSIVIQSSLDPVQVGGKGAGIYLEAFSTATIARSELSLNTALGLNAAGAALYCDGCTLALSATTFADNEATSAGGGVYIAPGSNVSLSHVTLGYNKALMGASVYTDSNISVSGLMSANNGAGVSGDDLECNSTTLTAQHSFADHPRCGTVTGLLTRAGLDETVNLSVLRSYIYQPFLNSVSRVLMIETGSNYFIDSIPASECTGEVDQYKQTIPAAQAAYPARGRCSYGSWQTPILAAGVMVKAANVSDAKVPFDISFGPSADTYVQLRALGGVGEACDMPTQTILYKAGDIIHTFYIDPATVFKVPVLGRSSRICEFEAVATTSSTNVGEPDLPGDPLMVGATSGSYYIWINDNTAALAAGISTPAPQQFLDIGTVPVATGGTKPIVFHPDTGGWNVTSFVLDGPNPDKFDVTTTLPLLTIDRVAGTTNLDVHCKGGSLGDYGAQLVLYTDNPQWPALVYGLHCKVAHFLSVTTNNTTVLENVAPSGFPVVNFSLDSANIGPAFDVTLSDLGGTAAVGYAYQAFDQVVHFNTGDIVKSVPIAIIDDHAYEDTRTFALSAAVDPAAGVVQVGGEPTTVTILDNELPGDNISVAISGIPSHSPAGAQVVAAITLTNLGADPEKDTLEDLLVVTTVAAPARIISYTVQDADCVISADYRSASCPVPVHVYPGETATVNMVIEMAQMIDPPQIKTSGLLETSVSGRLVTQKAVRANGQAPFVIVPHNVSTSGGAAGGLLLLLMASGLAWRRMRQTTAGRGGGSIR